jgi:hypothetical protein
MTEVLKSAVNFHIVELSVIGVIVCEECEPLGNEAFDELSFLRQRVVLMQQRYLETVMRTVWSRNGIVLSVVIAQAFLFVQACAGG